MDAVVDPLPGQSGSPVPLARRPLRCAWLRETPVDVRRHDLGELDGVDELPIAATLPSRTSQTPTPAGRGACRRRGSRVPVNDGEPVARPGSAPGSRRDRERAPARARRRSVPPRRVHAGAPPGQPVGLVPLDLLRQHGEVPGTSRRANPSYTLLTVSCRAHVRPLSGVRVRFASGGIPGGPRISMPYSAHTRAIRGSQAAPSAPAGSSG